LHSSASFYHNFLFDHHHHHRHLSCLEKRIALSNTQPSVAFASFAITMSSKRTARNQFHEPIGYRGEEPPERDGETGTGGGNRSDDEGVESNAYDDNDDDDEEDSIQREIDREMDRQLDEMMEETRRQIDEELQRQIDGRLQADFDQQMQEYMNQIEQKEEEERLQQWLHKRLNYVSSNTTSTEGSNSNGEEEEEEEDPPPPPRPPRSSSSSSSRSTVSDINAQIEEVIEQYRHSNINK
jgi:hypothetical protein